MSDIDDASALARWRLILGRFADSALPAGVMNSGRNYSQMDLVLDYLYNREYKGRSVRDSEERTGTLDPSQLAVPEWIRQVRELFPTDTVEILERHALDRYNLTELVTDAETLRKLEPNFELLKMMLAFKGLMSGETLDVARSVVRHVVEELKKRLTRDVRRVFWGHLNRQRRTHLKVANNLDWRQTIRANLKNYDVEHKRIVVESLRFFSRVKRHIPCHIIMAVDLSGSMAGSVIHSAVMAGIFNGLPAMKVSLIAFDTSIVDLSDRMDDPTELLMSVQLGGGTDIAGALAYCEGLVVNPHKTVLVLVTDFCEGHSVTGMLTSIKRLKEGGARVLGLAALDEQGAPVYDRAVAQMCVDAGAEVAALTPKRLAEWLEKVIS